MKLLDASVRYKCGLGVGFRRGLIDLKALYENGLQTDGHGCQRGQTIAM